MTRPAHAPIKILVLKWSALGDAAIASAAFEDIRRGFPSAQIHLNTLPPVAKLFADDPRFDRVFCIDVRARRQRLDRKASAQQDAGTSYERQDKLVRIPSADRAQYQSSACVVIGAHPRLDARPA